MVASMVGHWAANWVGKMEYLMVAHSVDWSVEKMVVSWAAMSVALKVVNLVDLMVASKAVKRVEYWAEKMVEY